ncbi:MAG TPA: hypothetical protein EYH48_01550 [Aquifex aeolicus]|nr:hypothetical protein [Aquificales bacterium]HIQ26009.1 hypothetical protein [Aquifex aeolicus]
MKVNQFGKKLLLLPLCVGALEVNEKLSVDFGFNAVYQHVDFLKKYSDKGCGSLAAEIGVNFHPTTEDEFQATFSLAGGNGLKETFGEKGFLLAPNADDLESDLKDINSSGRNYILEAWYKHTFKIGKEISVEFTAGIIDATSFIDTNEYANDETSQFMNDVFVNNPLASLPSYDGGLAVSGNIGSFTLQGLVMTSKTEEDKNYNYYAFQVEKSSSVGDGTLNFRVYYYRTSKDFLNNKGEMDYLEGIGISADWGLEDRFGLFARVGLNTNTSTGDFKNLLSGGVALNGALWGRKGDNFSVGVAYLKGNNDIKDVKVLEGYYSFELDENITLTLDYQRDITNFTREKLEASVYGIRLNVAF